MHPFLIGVACGALLTTSFGWYVAKVNTRWRQAKRAYSKAWDDSL